MTGIADTGFLVAFANRRDQFFPWALRLSQNISEPLLTCEAVLAETAFHLKDSTLVLRMIETGLITVAFEVSAHLEEIRKLAERYHDRHPDLADLCLVRLSELFPRLPVFTVDGDFKIYRRNKRQAIPVVMPPELD